MTILSDLLSSLACREAPENVEIMLPDGAEKQPKAGDRKPRHREANNNDQGMVNAGPLGIVHDVKHPEEVPPAPCVIWSLQHLAGSRRDVIAAVPGIAEVDLPDGQFVVANSQWQLLERRTDVTATTA